MLHCCAKDTERCPEWAARAMHAPDCYIGDVSLYLITTRALFWCCMRAVGSEFVSEFVYNVAPVPMSWSSFVRNSTRAVSRGSQLLSCSVAKHAVCSQTSLMALGSSRASVPMMFAASSITQLQRSLQSAPLSMLARSVMQSAPAMPPPASTSTVAGSSDTTSLEAGSGSEGGSSGVLMGSDDEENIPRRQKSKHRPPDRQHDPGGDIYLLSRYLIVFWSMMPGDPDVWLMFACFAAPSYSSERKQRQLLPHEQKELDARAKELKSLKGLKRLQMGQAGPTAGWLATVGVQLACHELLEVVLPQGSPYPREFVSGLLENSQDCVPVSSRGRFLVMYRDRNLPRPASSLLPGRAPPPSPESSLGQRSVTGPRHSREPEGLCSRCGRCEAGGGGLLTAPGRQTGITLSSGHRALGSG
ncbi:hypothetical protein QJQ45_029369 [Haematococcus lacustris]|nr:hypothetical protein QJQ45_029369 [Haematococcus lacustris]